MCLFITLYTDLMYFEKALFHLVFLQAVMRMIDKSFKGSKLICLLPAGLMCHSYKPLESVKCAMCSSTPVFGHWTISQDVSSSDILQLSEYFNSYLKISSNGTNAWTQQRKKVDRGAEEKQILPLR